MIAAAGPRRTANLDFQAGRAQDAARLLDGRAPFDLVVSVAMLHWIPATDQPGVLENVRSLLRSGGIFRAEFGGEGQIRAVQTILDEESERLGGSSSPWYFPGAGEYRSLLEQAGFRAGSGAVRLRRQRRPFAGPDGLLGWLRSQVLIAYEPALPPAARDAFRAAAESRALGELRRRDGTYDLDFVRLDLLATAP